MTVLDCCAVPRHVREEYEEGGNDGGQYRCANCGASWSLDEYNLLVIEANAQEQDERDAYGYDDEPDWLDDMALANPNDRYPIP